MFRLVEQQQLSCKILSFQRFHLLSLESECLARVVCNCYSFWECVQARTRFHDSKTLNARNWRNKPAYIVLEPQLSQNAKSCQTNSFHFEKRPSVAVTDRLLGFLLCNTTFFISYRKLEIQCIPLTCNGVRILGLCPWTRSIVRGPS
jgi:hypothetical protein